METSNQIQQKRVSKEEQSLIRTTFHDREDILLALRNLFFGFPLDANEKHLIEGINTPKINRLLRKLLLPELQKDIPIGQSVDLWMTVQIPSLDQAELQLTARKHLIEALESMLKFIQMPDAPKIDLSIEEYVTHAGLITRNSLITHIETQLLAIRYLANEKEETEDQKQERLTKDSSR